MLLYIQSPCVADPMKVLPTHPHGIVAPNPAIDLNFADRVVKWGIGCLVCLVGQCLTVFTTLLRPLLSSASNGGLSEMIILVGSDIRSLHAW